jgi:hypothetical protein
MINALIMVFLIIVCITITLSWAVQEINKRMVEIKRLQDHIVELKLEKLQLEARIERLNEDEIGMDEEEESFPELG